MENFKDICLALICFNGFTRNSQIFCLKMNNNEQSLCLINFYQIN